MSGDPKLDWRAIQSFLGVVRFRKLTIAAKSLAIDHSTLSRRIKGLEQELRVKLFERRTTGYVLTADGEALYQTAERMESELMRVSSRFSEHGLGISGTLKIGAPDGFATCFLMPRVWPLTRLYPKLSIQMITTPRLISVANREVHVWIAPHVSNERHLHAYKLTDYELCIYAAKSYVARSSPIVTLEDVENHPLVGFPKDLLYSADLDFASMFIKHANMPLTSPNVLAQVAAAVGGGGLIFLPNYVATHHPELVPILPESTTFERSYWLIVHSDMKELATVKVFNRLVTKEVRKNQKLFLPRRLGASSGEQAAGTSRGP